MRLAHTEGDWSSIVANSLITKAKNQFFHVCLALLQTVQAVSRGICFKLALHFGSIVALLVSPAALQAKDKASQKKPNKSDEFCDFFFVSLC